MTETKEELLSKKCKPCEGGVDPLSKEGSEKFLSSLSDSWKLSDDAKWISAEWKFPNYKSAWDFINEVGRIAESENHHPDIVLKWGYARIDLSTHAIGGLSENDFIVAAKIDSITS